MSNKNYVDYFFIGLITAGATITEAAFSMVGMLLLLRGSPIPRPEIFAAASGVFAAGIEGEVFLGNIKPAFWDLISAECLEHKIVEKMLVDLCNKNNEKQQNKDFFSFYRNLLTQLKTLKSLHHKTKEHKEKIRELERYKFVVEETIVLYLRGEKAQFLEDIKNQLNAVFNNESEKKFHQIYRKKRLLMYLAQFTTFISMVGCYCSMLGVAQSALLFVGLTSSFAMGGAIFIATIAALSYAFVTYRTLMQIIYSDFFSAQWTNLKKLFIDGGAKKRFAMILTTMVFMGLLVCLTLATAGTWWHMGLAGQQLLIHMASLVSKLVMGLFLVPYILTGVLFNIKNSAETLEQLQHMQFSKAVDKIKKELIAIFREPFEALTGEQSLIRAVLMSCESCTHGQLPVYTDTVPVVLIMTLVIAEQAFRYIAQPMILMLICIAYLLQAVTHLIFTVWNVLAFLGHCLSEGVTVDNAFIIPNAVAAASNAIAEGLTDFHYVHETENTQESHKSELSISEEEGHHHSNILGRLLCIALFPLLALNLVLYKLLSQKTWKESAEKNFLVYWGSHSHDSKDTKISEFIIPKLWGKQKNYFSMMKQKSGAQNKAPVLVGST